MRIANKIIVAVLLLEAGIQNYTLASVMEFTEKTTFISATGIPQHSIDFETLGDGTPIVDGPVPLGGTGQYISGNEWANEGIYFQPYHSSDSLMVFKDNANWTPASGSYGLYIYNDPHESSYVINFSTPVRSFGMMLCDSEFTSPYEKIILYNANEQILGTFDFPAYGSVRSGPEANYFRGYLSNDGIAKIVILEAPLESEGDREGVPLDDIIFTVPEPATLLLLGLGWVILKRKNIIKEK